MFHILETLFATTLTQRLTKQQLTWYTISLTRSQS